MAPKATATTMLYCGIQEVETGMVVAASVFHPRRPDVELLAPGVPLDIRLLARLRALGVHNLWVEHDLTADLDDRIHTGRSPALQTALDQLRHDFRAVAQKTVSAGHVQAYRQIVMQLTCELIANRNLSGLTERLIAAGDGEAGDGCSLFTHSANVAYLALSVGLELETYIVRQRRAMALEHARDLTALGIGAMLHDIGKCTLPDALRSTHEIDLQDLADDPDEEAYRDHARAGYELLTNTRAPASARQVVLSHHQRWDGTGFPKLAIDTDERKRDPLHGETIHIFCRVVAAANVLDNLLRNSGGWWRGEGGVEESSPPICAALQTFASDRFEGWFDPVVRDMVLRRIPPFAVGSRVVLSDGRPAVVVAPSLEQPCRPAVRLLEQDEAATLDLQLHPGLHVAQHAGQDVSKYLYHLPERSALASLLTGRMAG